MAWELGSKRKPLGVTLYGISDQIHFPFLNEVNTGLIPVGPTHGEDAERFIV